MNLSKFLWTTISILLWSLLATLLSLYLIKQRAIYSLEELPSSFEMSMQRQSKAALANIQFWMRINALIKGKGLGMNSGALSDVFRVIESCAITHSYLEIPAKLECNECTPILSNNLKEVKQLLSEIDNRKTEYKNLLNAFEVLNENRRNKIELHTLIANDFADLLGSKSSYSTKGSQDLSFYSDGPFKWLPLLDDSSTSIDQNAASETVGSLAIDQIAEKLESLRKQSKSIVEEYQEISSKIKENTDKTRGFDMEIANIRLKISRLLLEGLKAEIL